MVRFACVALLVVAVFHPDRRGWAADVERVPAYWVDSEDVAPVTGSDFYWDGLHFVSPSRGWIVGGGLVLEVDGDNLRLWFVGRTWPSNLYSVAAVDASGAWACGAQRYRIGPEDYSVQSLKAEGLFVHWDGAQCSGIETRGIPSLSVDVMKLALSGPADGWAIARFEWETNRLATLLLRFDGRTWEPRTPGWPLGDQWSMADLCLRPNGGGWLVGSRGEGGDRRRPHAFRRRGDGWEEVPIPPVYYPSVRMNEVHCLDDGGAIVLGSGAFEDHELQLGSEPLLWTFRETWERVELPEELRSLNVTALAAVDAQDYWLAVSDGSRLTRGGEFFLHFSHGRWERVAGPALPRDVSPDYGVTQMQFVSPTEGWATAWGAGGGLGIRGLIFHYKDGVWRVRNWSWNWWDERRLGFELITRR